MPPPPPQTSQYLTILMTEKGWARPLFFVGFWRPPPPPPPQTSQYLTIYQGEGGRQLQYFVRS